MAAVKTGKTEHKTTIKIGHASGSENYSINGDPGDQTGREVRIDKNSNIRSLNPTVLLRPKKKSLARKSAAACEAACNNSCIGYSQDSRNTTYDEAKKVDFDLAKIANPCNTDCSAFMTLCAVAGGATFAYHCPYCGSANAPTTDAMALWFTSEDDYEEIRDKKYLTYTDYLKRGDVLVNESQHTVMVLENGCKVLDNVKILLTVSDIKPTKTSVKIKVVSLDNTEEEEDEILLDDEEAELYKWEFIAKALDDNQNFSINKLIELKKGIAEISLTGLAPGKSYILSAVAQSVEELDKEAIYRSVNVIFTTPFEFPTAVSKLKVKFGTINGLNTKCTVTFNEPSSWGSTRYKGGYRVYLLINGKAVGYSDTFIKTNNKTINETASLKDIAKNVTINYNDALQIGVQPWLEDDDNNIIFDSTYLSCSQPFYNKHFLNTIDKLFIKIKDTFKQAILYHTN